MASHPALWHPLAAAFWPIAKAQLSWHTDKEAAEREAAEATEIAAVEAAEIAAAEAAEIVAAEAAEKVATDRAAAVGKRVAAEDDGEYTTQIFIIITDVIIRTSDRARQANGWRYHRQ
jgi:hypothetical protein